ncbi:paraquat-inducible protein A [Psychromarinibacter sp. C21-152]|uniref:Paraquat-inducible protein A n=1 Tax=Psychromarinibacter sediminicola TaxID=3033385 RepID=A0AAE3NQM3_9RHOB|nr:paraquat-inducible protein A [Psychromarinibacter sediminicola]MDF0600241.1 paraquat-inducible protein A [Psychromarinibacter sediminicola]
MEVAGTRARLTTARSQGLVACHRCGRVHAAGTGRCTRCGGAIESRDAASLQRVWAWLLAGIVVYIPANVYPMLRTATLLDRDESTIVGGVIDLFQHGSYAVAAIVFIASVVIPIGKFLAIAYLALGIRRTVVMNAHQRHRLFEVVEFIGRWSMIDVFVVAILSALVQLGSVAIINPGIAAVSFALSVAFTMLSAQSLDPRLIWDADEEPV